MKKECAIVQDLLVLYEDDVLKEESRSISGDVRTVCRYMRTQAKSFRG